MSVVQRNRHSGCVGAAQGLRACRPGGVVCR